MPLRETLEIIYFISGPIIAIIAFIGLRQLKISKKTAEITAKREAYTLSTTQCKYFAEEIIPLFKKLDDKLKKNNMPLINKSKVIIKNREIRVEYPKKISFSKEVKNINTEFTEIIDVLNKLESFALFFTSKMADEEIVFVSVGETYCEMVKKMLPVFMLIENKNNIGKNPLMILFILWYQRIEKSSLIEEKTAIETRLKSLQDKKINAIGTTIK